MENPDIALRQQVAALTAQNATLREQVAELSVLKARYGTLIGALAENGKQHAAAQDDEERSRCARAAPRLLLRFLLDDRAVQADRRITAPLADLGIAAHDGSKGANSALLHQPPLGSKPSGTAQETVQGVLLAAVYQLKKSGMGTDMAIAWVIDKARRVNVLTERGAHVQPKQLTGWWKDRGRVPPKLPALAIDVFNHQRAMINARPAAEHQRQQAERWASLLLQSLVSVVPRSAPDPINRSD